jgi:DNA invertase Pin-like site-specific DNA recombinase
MSDPDQNPRSPQQQFDTIDAAIRRLNYPWEVIRTYQDDHISGRLIRQRPALQEMLNDIYTGRIKIDAILADTYERFGRNEELVRIRERLRNRYGVLILCADSGFADPTTASGRVMVAFEDVRATEDNRIKAHNVLRGKKDCAKQKHWPGGPAPFGYRLETVMKMKNGRQEVDFSILVPNPPAAATMRRAFEMAGDGLGACRIARVLNEDPDVPQEFKPFIDQSVHRWLGSPIYKGVLVYALHATDIVNDRRVRERNPLDEQVIVSEYCEAIVPEELWDRVQAIRRVRGARARTVLEAAKPEEKSVRPVASGISLKYPLSGLVVCGHCGRAMVCGTSSPYTNSSGETVRYTHYHCPGRSSRLCPNQRRVPEKWLRDAVFGLVRERLFPVPSRESPPSRALDCMASVAADDPRAGPSAQRWTAALLQSAPWFRDLMGRVREEFNRLHTRASEQPPLIGAEIQDSRKKVHGWTMSLANPDLAHSVRSNIESLIAEENTRVAMLTRRLEGIHAADHRLEGALDEGAVVERLNRLSDVLAENNPSRCNIELSLHIEGIHCYQDRRVVVRSCRLGGLAGAIEQLTEPGVIMPQAAHSLGVVPVKARRRTLRRAGGIHDSNEELDFAGDLATDVGRFNGLASEWFWEDKFEIPVVRSWHETHALAVAAKRKETGWTEDLLAIHFGKSRPTIRAAMNYARSIDPTVAAEPRKVPPARWANTHYLEVKALLDQGLSRAEIGRRLSVGPWLVGQAVALLRRLGLRLYAKESLGEPDSPPARQSDQP